MDKLALPLKRKYAEEIVAGTKVVEFREVKPHYGNRIFDKRVMAWRDLHVEDGNVSNEEFDCADPVRQVRMIHFYDYNGTWSLDVSIKETGIIALDNEGLAYLNTAFNCHEMDDALAELSAAGVPEDERPLLFYFAIDTIISSHL